MKYRKLNASECPKCGVTVISRYTRDYKECGCPNHTMADGGFDYNRYGGIELPKRPEIYERVE